MCVYGGRAEERSMMHRSTVHGIEYRVRITCVCSLLPYFTSPFFWVFVAFFGVGT